MVVNLPDLSWKFKLNAVARIVSLDLMPSPVSQCGAGVHDQDHDDHTYSHGVFTFSPPAGRLPRVAEEQSTYGSST